MRVGVISDIHGNAAALETVLEALEDERLDAVWCLGDLVGYGPDPNTCCELVAMRADLCLVGNHDLGVIGTIPLDDFSPDAAAAARWTGTVLTEYSRSYLESLRPEAKVDGAELYHASPRDPVWDYVLSEPVARESLEMTDAPVVMVGHSHVPLAMMLENGRANGGLAAGGHEADLARGRWLLNPGSVGQPRDNDPRAAYLILDFEQHQASFMRVAYPVERTQAEIRERGLPETLAQRLALGL
jgi:predicted phosphodiesterase